MILLQSDSPPKPAKNVGDVDIPPYGLALCIEADNVNAQDSESEFILKVRSTSGNDENGSGTFESDFHYHNQIAINGGATLKQNGHGYVTFPGYAPFAAAVDGASSVTTDDLLMATSSSAKLKKLDRGEPESPGDCTNIFGLFRPLKQTSSGIWLVQRLSQPMWRVKALEDGEEGDEVVCEILQQGDAGEEFETAIGKKITVVVTDDVSEDDKFLVGQIAGAIVRIGSGGARMVLFTLDAPVEGEGTTCCGSGGWRAKTLWDATGQRAPSTITVYDQTGCHLEGDEEDLKGAMGIAVKMSPREEEGGGGEEGGSCVCWVIVSLCPAQTSSGSSGTSTSEESGSEGSESGESGSGGSESGGSGSGQSGSDGSGSDGSGSDGSGSDGSGSDGSGSGSGSAGSGSDGSGSGSGSISGSGGSGSDGSGSGSDGSGSGSGSIGSASISLSAPSFSLSVSASMSGSSSGSSSASSSAYDVTGCPGCDSIPSSLTVTFVYVLGGVQDAIGHLTHTGDEPPPDNPFGPLSPTWKGSVSLPGAGTIHLAFRCAGGLYTSCDGSNWGVTSVPLVSCDPVLFENSAYDSNPCGGPLVLRILITE